VVPTTTRPRSFDDRGASLVSTSVAVLVFLVFLLFAVQITVGLFGRSVVTSAAYDGARSVAGARVDHGDPGAVARAQSAAVDRMRQQLGDVGTRATFDWSGTDADTVVLRVQADNPRFSIPGLTGPLATDHIDRTVRARVERFQ
jgi:Flp pilus assembly protein TadG